ncbi:MAG: hypothetical protein ACOYON_10695 [Fimbriimonas sp.]
MKLVDGLPPIVSAAFFGYRSDRETGRYYRLLLNDFVEKTGHPVLVYTNEPTGFHPLIKTQFVDDLNPYIRRIWPDPEWQERYRTALAWHSRNQRLAQASNPKLAAVYLSKLALFTDALENLDEALWLDAGLLFSVYSGHEVPDSSPGYSLERIESQFIPMLRGHRENGTPLVATIPRRWNLLKNHRPQFHGMSYNDMSKLAQTCRCSAQNYYVVSGLFYFPKAQMKSVSEEFGEVWNEILKANRVGTEENVMSILSWRHGYDHLPMRDWVQMLGEPPKGWA